MCKRWLLVVCAGGNHQVRTPEPRTYCAYSSGMAHNRYLYFSLHFIFALTTRESLVLCLPVLTSPTTRSSSVYCPSASNYQSFFFSTQCLWTVLAFQSASLIPITCIWDALTINLPKNACPFTKCCNSIAVKCRFVLLKSIAALPAMLLWDFGAESACRQ